MSWAEVDDRIQAAVAAKLKCLRLDAGLTMTDVAIAARTFRPIVGRIERGGHMPSLETCQRIAEACGGSMRDVAEAIDSVLKDVLKEVHDGALSQAVDVQGLCRDCGQRLRSEGDA